MWRHRASAVLALLLLLTGAGPTSRASFVITIGDQTIPQGGAGFVDVLIRSDNPSGDLLTGFGFEFVITPVGPRTLQFVDPQPDPQLADPAYVFFGNSANLIGGTQVGVVSASGGGVNNRFVGGDDTEDASDVLVTGDRLLVRLALTAALGVAPIAGDIFTITLEPTLFTSFDSNDGPIDYSSTPGRVTITGPAAVVPEPSTFALALLASALAGAARCGRLRRRLAGAECSLPTRPL
jgi:hypothetical protein